MTPSTTAARRSHSAAPGRNRSVAPAIPRRVSGPVARPAVPVPAARVVPAAPAASSGTGPLQRRAALPDHRVLDRLLRGRVWIWMIGICLGGIVAMQVSLLKLNTGISRAVQTSATLEHQNASLQSGIARLSSQDRIQRAATALGMGSPEAGEVVHVRARGPVDGRRAANRMSEPSAQAHAMVAGTTTDAAASGAVTATTAPATAGSPAPEAAAAPTAAAPTAAGPATAASPPIAPVAATTAPAIVAPVSPAPAADAATAPQG